MPTPHLEVSRGGIKPATLFHSSSLRLTKDQFKERLKALNSDMRAQDFEIDRCIHHRTSGPQLICKAKGAAPSRAARAAYAEMFIRPQKGRVSH